MPFHATPVPVCGLPWFSLIFRTLVAAAASFGSPAAPTPTARHIKNLHRNSSRPFWQQAGKRAAAGWAKAPRPLSPCCDRVPPTFCVSRTSLRSPNVDTLQKSSRARPLRGSCRASRGRFLEPDWVITRSTITCLQARARNRCRPGIWRRELSAGQLQVAAADTVAVRPQGERSQRHAAANSPTYGRPSAH